MLLRRLIAFPGLDAFAVPIQIVELELHELHLRVLGQHLVQILRRVMEGKAHVLYQTLLLLLPEPVVAVKLFVHLVMQRPNVVDQIVIKVFHTGFFKLGLEYFVPILKRFYIVRMELGGEGIAVSGVAVRQGGLNRALALIAAVHPGRVKIGKATADKQIHHLLHLLYINAAAVVFVQQRQTHKAEAKFFRHNPVTSLFPLLYMRPQGPVKSILLRKP